MKKTFLIVLYFISIHTFSQNGFEVTTLDSIYSSGASPGVHGLTAVEYGGNIHLAYFYGSDNGSYYLRYEVRNNGQRISMEDVHEFSSTVWDGTIALQFDQDGHPYIYCSCTTSTTLTSVFYKTGQWTHVAIDYKAQPRWISSSANGSSQLGFATTKKADGLTFIHYFSYEDGNWIQTTVSSTKEYKTQPFVYHSSNGDIYVAYMEGNMSQDTTTLFIQKRTEEGWVQDYKQIFPVHYNGSFWTKFGEFNGNVHLLHDINPEETGDCTLRHLVKTEGSWQEANFSNCTDYVDRYFAGCEVEFDNHGNLYWIDTDVVRWINSSNEYDDIAGPLEGNYYKYLDFVVKDDELHIYARGGNVPSMYYEARANLSELTNATQILNTPFEVIGISPNPGNEDYRLMLKSNKQAEIYIDWIDLQGRKIVDTQKYQVQQGTNTINLSNNLSNQGIYYIRLSIEGNTVTLPVVYNY